MARKASYTRAGIAEAAIRIADREGLEALTMRRLAAELGAGTMTLYHYVRTKDDLLALVTDALMGDVIVPDGELNEGWRPAMTAIARRTRDVFVRHPWAAEVPKDVEDGPNAILHFEQSLAAMRQTGLDYPDCLELIVLVDEYVFGYIERFNAVQQHLEGNAAAIAAHHSDELVERLSKLDPERFPNLHGMFAAEDPRAAIERLLALALDPGRFERGLAVLLDGIERRVAATVEP